MALAIGSKATGFVGSSGTSLSFSHTVPAGDDRLLLVRIAVRSESGGAQLVSGVTFNGDALIKAGRSGATAGAAAEIWYLAAPDVATGNVIVTLTSAEDGIVAEALNLTGVDQLTPIGALALYNNAGDNAPSLAIVSAANQIVFDALATYDFPTVDATNVGTGQTQDSNLTDGVRVRLSTSHETGAASVTMSWSTTGTPIVALAAVTVIPAHDQASVGGVAQSGPNPQPNPTSGDQDNALLSTLTFEHTVVPGLSRLLLVSVHDSDGGGTPTSVTWNGTPLTLLTNHNPALLKTQRLTVYYLVAPEVGTFDIVVTLPGAARFVAIAQTFNSVDPSSPFGTPVTATASLQTSVSATATVAEDGICVDAVIMGTSAVVPTPGAGQELLASDAVTTPMVGAMSVEEATDSVTMSWSAGTDRHWGLVLIPLNPAPTPDPPTLHFYADFDLDGDYETDISADVQAFAGGFSFSRGANESGVYRVGESTIGLQNIDGKYTPNNPNSPLYGLVQPDIPVQVVLDFAGDEQPLWTGYLQTHRGRYDRDASRQISATFRDLLEYFRLWESLTIPAATARRTDEALDLICEELDIAEADRDFDVGVHTMPLHFTRGDAAVDASGDVTLSEMGPPVWIRKSGEPRFENRHSRLGLSPLTHEWGAGLLIKPYSIEEIFDLTDFVTDVRVIASVFQSRDEVPIFVFSRGRRTRDSLRLAAAGDPDGLHVWEATIKYFSSTLVPKELIAVQDYQANSAQSGNGTDRTASILATLTENTGTTGKLRLENTFGSPVYITKLQVRAEPEGYAVERPEFRYARPVSRRRGKAVNFDLPFVDDSEGKPRDYAVQLWNTYSEAIPREMLFFDFQRTPEQIYALASVELGQRVWLQTVEAGDQGPYRDDWYYIEGMTWRGMPGAIHNVSVLLAPTYMYRNLDDIVYDFLARPGPAVIGSADKGGPWQYLTGSSAGWDMNGTAVESENTGTVERAYLPLDGPDMAVRVEVDETGTSNGVILLPYRIEDTNNYMEVIVTRNPQAITLRKRVAGTLSDVAEVPFGVQRDSTVSKASQDTATGVNTLTFSHTVDAGDDRMLLVSVHIPDSGVNVSSVTWNGHALTPFVNYNANLTGARRVVLYAMVAPDEGTHNVVVTSTAADGRFGAVARSYSGVHQVSPFGGAGQASATADDEVAVTFSASLEDYCVDALIMGDETSGGYAANSGQTEDAHSTPPTLASSRFAASHEPGAASVTMGWHHLTGGASRNWAMVAVAIKPALGFATLGIPGAYTLDVLAQGDRHRVRLNRVVVIDERDDHCMDAGDAGIGHGGSVAGIKFSQFYAQGL